MPLQIKEFFLVHVKEMDIFIGPGCIPVKFFIVFIDQQDLFFTVYGLITLKQ